MAIFRNTKNNRTIQVECNYTIGDWVRVESFGDCYSYYKDAFDTLKGEKYGLTNVAYKDSGQFHSLEVDGDIRQQKELPWAVLSLCLHERLDDVILLIYQPQLKLGLMIGQEGVKPINKYCHYLNNDVLKFYVAYKH